MVVVVVSGPELTTGDEAGGATVAAGTTGAVTDATAVIAPRAPTLVTATAAAVLARLNTPARRITESGVGNVTAAASCRRAGAAPRRPGGTARSPILPFMEGIRGGIPPVVVEPGDRVDGPSRAGRSSARFSVISRRPRDSRACTVL